MAAPVYSYVTALDEVRLALSMKGTDAFITDAEIKRFIYENIHNTTTTWNFQAIITGTLYKCMHDNAYGLYLWGSGTGGGPTFTGTNDCTYTVNARGSIEVTAGTETGTSFTVTGTAVDFPNCMVQILHWLATHRAQEISASVGGGSTSSQGIHDQLLQMADYWTGIRQIA